QAPRQHRPPYGRNRGEDPRQQRRVVKFLAPGRGQTRTKGASADDACAPKASLNSFIRYPVGSGNRGLRAAADGPRGGLGGPQSEHGEPKNILKIHNLNRRSRSPPAAADLTVGGDLPMFRSILRPAQW